MIGESVARLVVVGLVVLRVRAVVFYGASVCNEIWCFSMKLAPWSELDCRTTSLARWPGRRPSAVAAVVFHRRCFSTLALRLNFAHSYRPKLCRILVSMAPGKPEAWAFPS